MKAAPATDAVTDFLRRADEQEKLYSTPSEDTSITEAGIAAFAGHRLRDPADDNSEVMSISAADLQKASEQEEKKPEKKKPAPAPQKEEEVNDPLASFLSIKHPEVLDKNMAEYEGM